MRRPILLPLLLALTALPPALPAQLPAQSGALRVEGAGRPATVPAASHRGYAAHAASALVHLGGRVEATPYGARVEIFGDTLEFESLSPFFRSPYGPGQLASPAYREGGALYLPRQFYVEWLPSRYADRLSFADGTLRLRPDAVAAAGTPADARPGGAAQPPRAQPSPARPPGPRVVVIDAGHGGRDPGKIGPNGLREKDVTLAVARRLADELRGRRGYVVHMTRDTDVLIPLAERPRLANEWKGDNPSAVFISIHANAHTNRSAVGFETFFLSEARTEDERRVAEAENAAVRFETNGAAEQLSELSQIGLGLRNDFYIRASHDLAEVVQRNFAGFHPGPNRGVKQAGFRVLVGAFMPAVLVELAFLSNDGEARLLGTASFQDRLSWSLANAVDQFFDEHEHLWLSGEE